MSAKHTPRTQQGLVMNLRPGSYTQLCRYRQSEQGVDSAKVRVLLGRYNEGREGSKGFDYVLISRMIMRVHRI